jgi:hypothetical protein
MFVNEQIMIFVELPEFTVDHVEVLVGEVLRDAVDISLFLQTLDHPQ